VNNIDFFNSFLTVGIKNSIPIYIPKARVGANHINVKIPCIPDVLFKFLPVKSIIRKSETIPVKNIAMNIIVRPK